MDSRRERRWKSFVFIELFLVSLMSMLLFFVACVELLFVWFGLHVLWRVALFWFCLYLCGVLLCLFLFRLRFALIARGFYEFSDGYYGIIGWIFAGMQIFKWNNICRAQFFSLARRTNWVARIFFATRCQSKCAENPGKSGVPLFTKGKRAGQ